MTQLTIRYSCPHCSFDGYETMGREITHLDTVANVKQNKSEGITHIGFGTQKFSKMVHCRCNDVPSTNRGCGKEFLINFEVSLIAETYNIVKTEKTD